MVKNVLVIVMLSVLTATGASAACFADYKAKRDDPLRLHYGVTEVSGECSIENAARQLGPKLAADGWELLTIVGVFDDAGLDERRQSAGEYYLRY